MRLVKFGGVLTTTTRCHPGVFLGGFLHVTIQLHVHQIKEMFLLEDVLSLIGQITVKGAHHENNQTPSEDVARSSLTFLITFKHLEFSRACQKHPALSFSPLITFALRTRSNL